MNFIALLIGYGVIGIVTLFVLTIICEFISNKIADFKDSKRTIKKGTIMYVDGERVEIKKNLNIRFKKTKVTVCKCDELRNLDIEGLCFRNVKDFAHSDFESKLLDKYKSNKQLMKNIIGE